MQDDQKRKAEDELERLLLEGLESEETLMTAQDWIDIRKEGRALVRARKKHKKK